MLESLITRRISLESLIIKCISLENSIILAKHCSLDQEATEKKLQYKNITISQ